MRLHPRFYADDDEIQEILDQLGDDEIVDAFVGDIIRQLPSGEYRLYSHEGKNLGTFATRAEAEKHEREVKFFKHQSDSATHIASGVMITAENTGRTLFLRRSPKYGDLGGTWAFPAGGVEPGETVQQAAARETREEIGYDPSDDMEQAHRASTSGVDFTTFIHSTAREFRPHLNEEHDAYKWALVEQAPEPLHPGVERTLDEMDHALRMRDEGQWNEELHPRDKTGKFTEKGSEGSKEAKLAAGGLHSHMMAEGDILGTDSNKTVFEVPKENIEAFKKHAATHGIALEEHGSLNYEDTHHGFSVKQGESEKVAPASEAPAAKTGIEHEAEAKTLVKVAKEQGFSVDYHPPSGTATSHTFVTNVQNADKLKALLDKNGNHYKTVPGSGVVMFKVPNGEDPVETQHGTYEEHKAQAASVYGTQLTPTPTPAPDHPSKKYLSQVKGTTAERVAMRKDLKTAKGDKKQELQHKIVASFWKQRDIAKKQGKDTSELDSKLTQYAKSYGVPHPDKWSAPAQVSKVAPPTAPKFDTSTPHGNLAQGLHAQGLNPEITTLPNGKKVVSVPTEQAKQAAEIAKYHGTMKLVPGMSATYQAKNESVFEPKPDLSSLQSKLESINAPLPQHAEPLKFSELTKVGEQMGSNEGGVYQDKLGNKYYVKSPKTEDHVKNELLAAKLYQLAGARTLTYVPVEGGKQVATKLESLDKKNVSDLSSSEKKEAQSDFAVHAWLANWDAAGTGGDNQGTLHGHTVTLDVGGSLEYRAKGSPKGDAFGSKVTEFDTMRDGPSPDNNKLFGKMTDDQIKESVDRLKGINEYAIRDTINSVMGPSAKSQDLAKKLLARRDDLIARADALGKAPKTEDISHLPEEDQRIHWLKKTTESNDISYHMTVSASKMVKIEAMGVTPAELGFIRAFTGPSSGVNKNLRDGFMGEHEFAFKHIMNDALDKFPVYEGDTLWRKIQLDAAGQAKYEPGKIVHWSAFSSTSKNPDTWSGNTHFTIRNPKSGRDVQFISENPSEAEVIMPADTYYKVLSKKQIGGVTNIELEEVLPFGKKKKKAA